MAGRLREREPKVLFVLPANVIGGAETWTFNVLRALNTVRPVLLTQKAMADACADLKVPAYWFEDAACRAPYDYSIGNAIAYARLIKRVIARERPDITMGLMHNGTVFLIVAMGLFRPRGLMIGSILGSMSAYFQSIGRTPSAYEKLLMRYGFKRLASIITPSEGVRQDLIEHYWAPPERVKAIHNGFDLEAIRRQAKAPLELTKDCPWIVSSCRFAPEKDFDTLLEAFRIIRRQHRVKLVLLGDGPLRQDILNKSVRLGIDDELLLPGFQSNPFPYISRADVFVLSSFYEGFGNVIVEAMVLGVPVVSSDCPYGPGEIIQHDQDGFLVEVGAASAMAESCLLLLEKPELRKEISRRGLLKAERFTLKAKVAELECHLLGLIGRPLSI